MTDSAARTSGVGFSAHRWTLSAAAAPVIRGLIAIGWHEHGLAYCLVGVHLLLLVIASSANWVPALFHPSLDYRYSLELLTRGVRWLPVLVIVELIRTRHQRPRIAALWTGLRRRYFNAVGIAGVLWASFLIANTAITHDRWKSLFGRLNPWSWDARLAHADRILHGGVDPWRILHPIFQAPALTIGLDTAYWVWFVVIQFVLAWALWSRRRRLRARFLLTWVLMWVVLGTIVAHAFASGGPAFYAHLVEGPDPYAPLVAHLNSVHATVPLTALNLQSQVWENAAAGGGQHWLAMSAMPSLHVAIAVLFALTASRIHRILAATAWSYTVIILLGSIYLGWHYALDGYVAVVLVYLLWRLAGWAVRNVPEQHPPPG